MITEEYYDKCIQCAEDPEEAIAIVNALPEVNRRIVMYMIAFVQVSFRMMKPDDQILQHSYGQVTYDMILYRTLIKKM